MGQQPEIVNPTHLTIPQACQRAGCGRSSLYLALGRGDVTARKLGTRVLVEVASLDSWVNHLPVWRPVIGTGTATA